METHSSLTGKERSEHSLTAEQKEALEREEDIFLQTLESLNAQDRHTRDRLRIQGQQARQLTSELVAARRDEDKQLLASDEAVSNALKDNKKLELDSLERLKDRPYFARLEVQEERASGPVRLDYKIGFETNLDCRIIDWRDAPLSKLFYHYEEGEEYWEEIHSHERTGIIAGKIRVDIKDSTLVQVSSSAGDFFKTKEGVWQNGRGSRSADYFRLPDVLSLITPDQFRLITEDARTAVLIQGVAGSGKTTVGLYRLAWLLRNSKAQLDTVAIVVRNPALKTYIERALPSIELEGLHVYSYLEWIALRLTGATTLAPILRERPPAQIVELKSSIEFADRLRAKAAEIQAPAQTDLPALCKWYHQILETTLESCSNWRPNQIKAALERCKENKLRNALDFVDLPLMLLALQHRGMHGYLPRGARGCYSHLVIDEVQDLNQVLLTTILQSVDGQENLTLLGDQNQNIHDEFPGWKQIIQSLNIPREQSKYLQLEVSFRCPLPIMRFAEYVQAGRITCTKGRSGRKPIWFICRSEENGLLAARQWLNRALLRYPFGLSAVLCRHHKEAYYVHQLLLPSFGNTIHLGTQDGFSSSDGLIVTSIAASKGLEFTNVLIWNPSARTYRANNTKERNLLYVAATRAQENLCVVSWGRHSECLPGESTGLTRVVNELLEDDQEGQ